MKNHLVQSCKKQENLNYNAQNNIQLNLELALRILKWKLLNVKLIHMTK